MSRPYYRIKIDGQLRKLVLDYHDPFPDPDKGDLRYCTNPGRGEPLNSALINIRDIHSINSLAVAILRSHGYDLDGLQAAFWLFKFHEYPDPQLSICQLLGDEYRWEPVDDEKLFGTIRRVLPRARAVDPLVCPPDGSTCHFHG